MKLFRYGEVTSLAIAILLLVTLVGGVLRARVLDGPSLDVRAPDRRPGLVRRAAAFFGRGEA